MGAKVRQKPQEEGGNIFWVTMSDLFIGMFMIFATLFFAFCANTGQGNGEAQAAVQQSAEKIVQEMQKQNIDAKIKVETTEIDEKDPQNADVEIDPFTGMAKISDLELFKLNSAELTPKGRVFLGKFLPVYFDAVLTGELRKHVTYVIIQGHTDSHLFRGNFTKQEQYMKNMNLSMNRAYNVANYTFQLCKHKPYYNDLTKILRVEGASSSKPITVNGKEDYKRSRRVELRLVLKPNKVDILQQFLQMGVRGNYENN